MMKVAVLLATYNGGCFLQEQLDSLFIQTYKDFTIYISDDGSIDETTKIIAECELKYPDKVHNISNHVPTGSAYKNFLYLLKTVESDVYLFCDQDDIWDRTHIEVLVKKYTELTTLQQQNPVVIHSDLFVVNQEKKILSNSFISYSNLLKSKKNKYFYFLQNDVTGCTMLINNSLKNYVFSSNFLIEKKLSLLPMHDWFFALIASQFGNIYFIDKQLVYYRQHENNSVGAKNVKKVSYLLSHVFKINKNKKVVNKTKNITKLYLDLFSEQLESKDLVILNKYVNLNKYIKIYRIFFLIRNKILKDTFLRKIGQLLYI